MTWNPQPENIKLLDFAMAQIKSVPYPVSSRWTFYRLLQHGFLPNKSKKWVSKIDYLLSRARKGFYQEWRPDTLVDSIRQTNFKGELFAGFEVLLDTIEEQDCYVQLWFEAEAMHGQFEHYTKDYRVSLIPFRGDCSIPIKWNIAKKLEEIGAKYQKPIQILYFGDCDRKGFQILDAAVKDIRAWCKFPFDLERVGLTQEQAKEFGLPENPEKIGTYQWEALDDQHAGKLILEALSKHQKLPSIELCNREKALKNKIRPKFIELLKSELESEEN